MPNNKHRRHHRRKINPIKVTLIVLGMILFIIVIAFLSALYMWKRSSVLNKEKMFVPQQRVDVGAPDPVPSPTPQTGPDGSGTPGQYDLFYENKYYKLRENVVSVLFMGIDSKKNESTESEIVNGTNQADTLLLGIFDADQSSVKVIHIPRDTEADVKVLDMTKRYVDTERMHICLQHAYGDGGKISCELTMDAVSGLLFGIPVNRYVSLGTNGVIKAVNAVGGVELTMLDDFSFYSDAMKKGETVKLNGKRALTYIQARQDKGLDGTDGGRMKRQTQFLTAFIQTVKEKSEKNPALILSVYDAVKDYLQTDLSVEELLFLANQGLDAGFSGENLISLPGTVGDEPQPLFHMDEPAAKQMIIDLFYQEILA